MGEVRLDQVTTLMAYMTAGERLDALESRVLALEMRERGLSASPASNKITVITPTGDRPEALALLRRWLQHQTRQPDQWIIVDDGKTPVNPKHFPTATVIRREPQAGEGHTLSLNLTLALPQVQGEKVVIMEDDDFYGRDYLQTMADCLDEYELVGGFPKAGAISVTSDGMIHQRLGDILQHVANSKGDCRHLRVEFVRETASKL